MEDKSKAMWCKLGVHTYLYRMSGIGECVFCHEKSIGDRLVFETAQQIDREMQDERTRLLLSLIPSPEEIIKYGKNSHCPTTDLKLYEQKATDLGYLLQRTSYTASVSGRLASGRTNFSFKMDESA